MKHKFLKSFLFSLCLLGQAGFASDAYSGAYGKQAVMSPASTSLSLGNANTMPQQNPSNYAQGNGVYLTGQSAMPQPMPAQANPYYAPPQAQTYSSPAQGYYPQTMPLDPMVGYGANSYTAYKPVYGQPPQMVQRNSVNYGEPNNYPYRRTPEVVLNPNSMTGYNPEAGKPQSSVMNILNGIGGSQRPNGNWLQRVFHRNDSNNTAIASPDQRAFGW